MSKLATATVHQSTVGTYHPAPATHGLCPACGERVTATGRATDGRYIHSCGDACHEPLSADIAWTIHDTRGYLDPGPACDECGACECFDGITDGKRCLAEHCGSVGIEECIGLSFAFTCLDGGESLCEDCAERAGVIIVPCDCGEKGR